MKHTDETKHIGMLFREVHKGIVTQLNKDLEKYGITLMQNEILTYIYFKEQKQNINQKDIEKFFNSSNPTITGILNRLQAKGLVIREASLEDARYKLIKLTEEGRMLVKECHHEKSKMMEQKLIKNLDLEEQEQLRSLLMKVIEGLNH